MKLSFMPLALGILFLACSHRSEPEDRAISEQQPMEIPVSLDSMDYAVAEITEFSEFEPKANEIPPSGKYQFDMAFAEWGGKSMGVKVTVEVLHNSIKIIYEGIGDLSNTKIGEIIDRGRIMKHQSGEWIIGNNPEDPALEEVGGCNGGPAIIDFKNKKYWTC